MINRFYEIVRDGSGKLIDILPISVGTIQKAKSLNNEYQFVQVIGDEVVQAFKDNEILVGGQS